MNIAAFTTTIRTDLTESFPITVTIAAVAFSCHGGRWRSSPSYDEQTGMATEQRTCAVGISLAALTAAAVTVIPGSTTATVGGVSALVTDFASEAGDTHATMTLSAIAPAAQLNH
jgi:hypothetical protein